MESNQVPGTSSHEGETSFGGRNQAASNRPRAGGAGKGPVPKWFKGTGTHILKANVYLSVILPFLLFLPFLSNHTFGLGCLEPVQNYDWQQ